MAKKSALGRGIESLLPQKEPVIEKPVEKKDSEIEKTQNIDINKIKPNKNQPRRSFDEDKLQELALSIKEHGIIQPIVVLKEKNTNDYIIVAGERRWRAAKLAGLNEIPVVYTELNDKELLEVSLIENIQRQDLNPIEEARAFKKLVDDFELTQEEVSKRVGKSRVSITNTMRLLNLDDRVLEYVAQGVITEGHGRALLGVENPEIQYKISQKIIDEGMSVRQAESYIKNYEKMNEIRPKTKKLDVFLKNLENKITEKLGTKVTFKPKNKDKGKIEIEYYSNEDLERILEFLEIQE